MDEDRRLARAERLSLLTQIAKDTPMGRLLRTFWHPIATSARLAAGTALGVRVLGEELTLYRGSSGAVYAIGGRCAHRCETLHTGWVEGETLRCMYHGWRYDGTGRCTQMPAERQLAPVTIAGYAVREYAGLIFAYLGELPAPTFELPRKDAFERPGYVISSLEQVWDCNWFQQVENALDGVHVSFVHVWGKASRLGETVSTELPLLSYEETAAGIRQTATRSGGNVRISNWTFPNNNHILNPGPHPSDPWSHSSAWIVPIDDEHSLRFVVFAHPEQGRRAEQFREEHAADFNPARYYDVLFGEHQLPELGSTDTILLQDYVALRGQGRIVDRAHEHLGASDAGIALLRRICFRELEVMQAGRPTKAWTRQAEPRMQTPTGATV